MVKKLIIAIHDLHPWGGQDKSNLEILYRVNQNIPMELHTYQFIDQRPWPQSHVVPYSTHFTKIFIIKQIYYLILTFFKFSILSSRKKRNNHNTYIQTTGTASAVADIVQVQFVHAAWKKVIQQFEIKSNETALKQLYQALLGQWNVLLEKIIFTNHKKYIAISHSVKKELMENFNISPENITTIYHGIDTDEFCPYSENPSGTETRLRLRQQLGILETDSVLLHVGALNDRKGVTTAIKTLGYLKKSGVANIHYIAIGSGHKPSLLELAKSENVHQQVHLLSHSKNVRDYYWASDIFFFPTVYEPFGLVVLEALSSGLCCVISTTAGGSELIEHKENGLLIKNIFDPQTMGDQLHHLMKDKDLQKKLSLGARALALKNNWDVVAKNYLDYYQSIGLTHPQQRDNT